MTSEKSMKALLAEVLDPLSSMPTSEIMTAQELDEGREIPIYRKEMESYTELAEGVVGTYIQDGRILDEPNPSKRPYLVRGQQSLPGEYDRAYRDSNAFRAVNEIRNLLMASSYDYSLPEEHSAAAEEHAAFMWDKLQKVKVGDQGMVGWKAFVEAASSAIKRGFSVFEIIWAQDEGTNWTYPKEFLFRHQSTVWRWIIDLPLDELATIEFRANQEGSQQWTLRAGGQTLTDQEVMLVSINREGHNYEGVSMLRPGLHWIAFKLLLARIQGAAAELQGVPIRYVRNALEALRDMNTDTATDTDLDLVLESIVRAEEGQATAIKLPNGVEVGILDSDGIRVDTKPMIDYCDRQVATAFASESSLLGHQQVGSYGMAESQDRQFLSQIPYYEHCLLQPVNALLQRITAANLGPDEDAPTIQMRFDASRDNQAFIADIIRLMRNGFWAWPLALQSTILEEMGLDTSIFEDWDPRPLLAILSRSADPEPALLSEPSGKKSQGSGRLPTSGQITNLYSRLVSQKKSVPPLTDGNERDQKPS